MADVIYFEIKSFSKFVSINHELIGIDFEAGTPKGVNMMAIRNVQDVPQLREQMLVAHGRACR